MLTAICPARNEEAFIENVIQFFLKAKPADKELFIVDGNSSDKTREIVSAYAKQYSNIHLLENPQQIVPFALNKAIKVSTGDPIVRLDAHTLYADDYFEKILETFAKTNADIVGGPMRAVGKTDFQKAVAYATSTKLGVGDSQFHDEHAEGYVDSVYLGAWRRNIFNEVGYFDEQMKRNQDDEFHYRAKSFGKKIYLNPEIKSQYFPRDSFSKLFKQYFEYGLYKPLVLRKVKSEIKLRHIVPSLFVLYLLLLPVSAYLLNEFALLPLLIYFALAILFAIRNKSGRTEKLFSMIIYPVLHIAYGSGFLIGLIRK
ncbi:MAG: glycosyltransferase family 2 protein [Bacteroidia bacterium]